MITGRALAMDQRTALGVREAAACAGISHQMLYKLWERGEGPRYFFIGTRRLIRAETLREWIARREVEANVA